MERTYRDIPGREYRRTSKDKERRESHYTRQYDYDLLFLTIGIALFGVVMIYSAGYYTAMLRNNPFRYVTITNCVLNLTQKFYYQSQKYN